MKSMPFRHTRALALLTGLAALAVAPLPAHADGDAAKGEKLFSRCKACHTVEQGGPNKVGPNLWGFLGTAAGSRDIGFRYSKAMQESGVVWDEDSLSAYLENPRKLIPGTRMVFAGLRKEDDREDLIAWLEQASQ